MPLEIAEGEIVRWTVRKIGVIGPGIVGTPMAALLAQAAIREGSDQPATVTVVQRNSPTSGWKVDAINAGRSPIGGIEPALDEVVAETVAQGLLDASHDYEALQDADVVLVCVQTDKDGIGPDYGPLLGALTGLARVLVDRPAGNIPLIVLESTLAPSSMATVVRTLFAEHGLVDGRDILLANSPNRVMPGRLVDRVTTSDKLVAGLRPEAVTLVQRLYRTVVTGATVYPTNSLTAELVKTLENAYRDVRIAFSAELVRYCDAQDIDFYAVRDRVNQAVAQTDTSTRNANAVPTGAVLIPTVGVGGHCLPKDGILLWWRLREAGVPTDQSLILEARTINDASPGATLSLAERAFGPLAGRSVSLLGTAYRFNSEDTRNSPTLVLAGLLRDQGARVRLHDPYVYPTDQNLAGANLAEVFTRDLAEALADAEIVILCTAHDVYADSRETIEHAPRLLGVLDGCNLFQRHGEANGPSYAGIGRGERPPTDEFVARVEAAFRAMEIGVANEVAFLADALNARYATTPFERIRYEDVQRLAGTCVTGCLLPDPGPVPEVRLPYPSLLVARATGVAGAA